MADAWCSHPLWKWPCSSSAFHHSWVSARLQAVWLRRAQKCLALLGFALGGWGATIALLFPRALFLEVCQVTGGAVCDWPVTPLLSLTTGENTCLYFTDTSVAGGSSRYWFSHQIAHTCSPGEPLWAFPGVSNLDHSWSHSPWIWEPSLEQM